jgi:hypothetical protein
MTDDHSQILLVSESFRSITDALARVPAIQNAGIVGLAMMSLPEQLRYETASVMRDLTISLENMDNLVKRIEMHSNTMKH